MSDKGAAALLREPPILEIDDKKYPLRRLGLLDIDRLSSIVLKATKHMDAVALAAVLEDKKKGSKKESSFTPEVAVSFLTDWLPHAFDEVIVFLASVIRLKPGVPLDVAEEKMKKSKAQEPKDPNEGTIRDPDVFPVSALPLLIEKLSEHPQVVDFFANSKGLASKLKTLIGTSSEPSTESSDDTDGQTSTSSGED